MNQATKRVIAVVFAIGLGFHVCMLFIYCTSINMNNRLNFVNNRYIYPVFHQNWNLFVPAPNLERKLFVRYKTKNGFCDWKDILSREIVNHKQNRLLGNEALVLLLSNSLIIELNSKEKTPSCVFINKPTNTEFKVLQFEVENYLRLEFQLKGPVQYELLLVSQNFETAKAYYFPSLALN
jgi:hypothetical protein